MNRIATVYRQKTLDDSGELSIDLNIRDPITGLYIEFRNKNGATENRTSTIPDDIDEIQLIDGSNVLWNMDGQEFVAFQHYWMKHTPYNIYTELPGLYQVMGGFIPFGRMRNDPQYGLDLTRFDNPQLRVKWSFNAAATEWVTGEARLTVLADIMMGGAAPGSYITAKEIKSFTIAASGDERTELPTDYPYLGLMLQSFEAGVSPDSSITDFKLTADTDRVVLVDLDTTDLIRLLSQWYPRMDYKQEFHVQNNQTIKVVPKSQESVMFVGQDTDELVFRYNNQGVGQGTIYIDSNGSAVTSDANVEAMVTGYMPYGVFYYPFGDKMDPSQYLSPGQFQKLELVLTQGNAGGTAKIVAVQLRSY